MAEWNCFLIITRSNINVCPFKFKNSAFGISFTRVRPRNINSMPLLYHVIIIIVRSIFDKEHFEIHHRRSTVATSICRLTVPFLSLKNDCNMDKNAPSAYDVKMLMHLCLYHSCYQIGRHKYASSFIAS